MSSSPKDQLAQDNLESCFVVAAYGLRTISMEQFYIEMLDWFRHFGRSPTHSGITGSEWSGRMGDYERHAGKLRKRGFSGVTAVSLSELSPHGNMPLIDWELYTTVCSDASYCVIGLSGRVTDEPVAAIMETARMIVNALHPIYAIAFPSTRPQGPALYAVGLNFGDRILAGEEYESALAVSRWGDIGMPDQVYREGLLRDVYPWNFLTEAQLSRRLGDATLKAWIESKGNRGSMRAFHRDVTLWEVLPTELPILRQELNALGAIFDWRRHASG
jgi:hypothetical protein